MLYICCVSLCDIIIVGLCVRECRRRTDWCVCVRVKNLIVYIWWESFVWYHSSWIFSHTLTTLSTLRKSHFCAHAHPNSIGLSPFLIKLFQIQTESAVISPRKMKRKHTHTHPPSTPPSFLFTGDEEEGEKWKEEQKKREKMMKRNVWGKKERQNWSENKKQRGGVRMKRYKVLYEQHTHTFKSKSWTCPQKQTGKYYLCLFWHFTTFFSKVDSKNKYTWIEMF